MKHLQNHTDKTFVNWTEDELIFTFGLKRLNKCPLLEKWLKAESTFSDFEQTYLEKFRTHAEQNITAWNEAELRAKLIDPITMLVNFDDNKYLVTAFSERNMQAVLEKTVLKGKVDWMVATGKNNPREPFFFIHEYKKESGGSEEPLAQLLAAMLAAQTLHKIPPTPNLLIPKPVHYYKGIPVYGCYIIGRSWFFVTLHNKEYCVSNAFNATEKEDLYKIVNLLKVQKTQILEMLKKNVGKLF